MEKLLDIIPHHGGVENNKIDVKTVRDFQFLSYDGHEGWMVPKMIDTYKSYRSIISKHVPAERSNGIFNLLFAFVYPNTTSQEVESALVNICISAIRLLRTATGAIEISINQKEMYGKLFSGLFVRN